MRIEPYLERIDYRGPRIPEAGTLAGLHEAHLRTVPFENLDILRGLPVRLSPDLLYEKIVRRRRGGFCFELNGLFGWLLGRLGFRVTLLSARVFEGGRPGPDFEHALLRVQGQEEWIADVGFGESFLRPLSLVPGREGNEQGVLYRVLEEGTDRILERMRPGGGWEPQYAFTLAPRRLADFDGMCRHLSTSPASRFTRKVICSRATPEGRVTISGSRLIVTSRGKREERDLTGEADSRKVLWDAFGIRLDEIAGAGSTASRDGV